MYIIKISSEGTHRNCHYYCLSWDSNLVPSQDANLWWECKTCATHFRAL